MSNAFVTGSDKLALTKASFSTKQVWKVWVGSGVGSCLTIFTNIFVSLLLFAAEPEQDFITCGDCQHEFKLCDITKFIQHKVNGCNKENVDPFENSDSGEPPDADREDAVAVGISNRRTSISAPIANRSTPELRAGGDKTSPRPSRDLPSTAPDGAKTSNNDSNVDDDEDASNDEDDNEAAEARSATSRRSRNNEASASTSTSQGQLRFSLLHRAPAGATGLDPPPEIPVAPPHVYLIAICRAR